MKKQSEILLNDIIEHAKLVDERNKEKARLEHQGEKTLGESWLTHHLKSLRRLLEDDR